MQGEALSSGISFGKAFIICRKTKVEFCSICREDVILETERFKRGRGAAAIELKKLIKKVSHEMGEDKAEIFEGHLEILMSEELEEEILQIISDELLCAELAVKQYSENNAKEMEELDDKYFKERGQDFRDIGEQIIKGIRGDEDETHKLPDRAIVVSEEMTPSQTAAMDLSRVAGFVIQKGGVNSHTAILARSLELPAVILREPNPTSIIREGDSIYLNGETGEIWVNPEEEQIKELEKNIRRLNREKRARLKLLEEPSETLDGLKIDLYSNVGGICDIQNAVRYHADGIGLFRTEFLFMESASCPTLEKQTQVYRQAIEAMGGRNVIIRLLDTGADKPLPYWTLPSEENPFLGVRGIRLLLQKVDTLRTQIQALLLASESGPVGMMLPMVGSLGPIEKVKQLVEEEKRAMDWKGPDNLKLGVMIETPAAVILIEEILDAVDFISIGTNDLTQYTLAADRGNPYMNDYYDEFHPAVIRSIAHTIKTAKKKGKLNGVCGELAGNSLALPFFVGLGVDELSAVPSRLLEMKRLIRSMDSIEASHLVEELLRMPTSEGIRARLNRYLREKDLVR
jgi:phosphoenolpyruvate-protein phosphotransferase (PTS system enzyme I)